MDECMCHFNVGMLQEFLTWAGGGKIYHVLETECIAQGGSACTIRIEKSRSIEVFMLKIILQSKQCIPPFNEPARDLRIQNKPLWLHQRDVLAPYIQHELELPPGARLPQTREACLIYRDNLFFDQHFIQTFMPRLAPARTRRALLCR
jgi:hypothetical protein